MMLIVGARPPRRRPSAEPAVSQVRDRCFKNISLSKDVAMRQQEGIGMPC